MSAATTTQLLAALDPRVTAFHNAAFTLREDLEWLDRLRQLRASVAVILHSARILEVLVREAVALARLAERGNPGDDARRHKHFLQLLKNYGGLPNETFLLLDALRELGNKARHVLGKVTPAHAEHAYAIVLRGLQWFFCDFPQGKKLPSLSHYNQPLDSLLPLEVARLLALLESKELDRRGFVANLRLKRSDCPLLVSPVFAAVLIEKLLNGKWEKEAQAVLTEALDRFPDDIRLQQLQGLHWSRTGKVAAACDWLEKIEATGSTPDEETQGILAGAYKRRANEDPARQEEWLKQCQAAYEQGWQQSQRSNTYLGINAAALALWLGRPDDSVSIAKRVRDVLEDRRRTLADARVARFLNCWDQLTLAEAHLLLGEWEASRQCYREAADRFPTQTKALDVAREQAHKDLAALGRHDLIAGGFPG